MVPADESEAGGPGRGEKSLSLKSLVRVADALEVDLAWLVRGEGSATGEAECGGLMEELLGQARDLPPEELRHVLEVVKTVKSYLVGHRRD